MESDMKMDSRRFACCKCFGLLLSVFVMQFGIAGVSAQTADPVNFWYSRFAYGGASPGNPPVEYIQEMNFNRTGVYANGSQFYEIKFTVAFDDEEAAQELEDGEVIGVTLTAEHISVGPGMTPTYYPPNGPIPGHMGINFNANGFEVLSGQMSPQICGTGDTAVGVFQLKYVGPHGASIQLSSSGFTSGSASAQVLWCQNAVPYDRSLNDVGNCQNCNKCDSFGNETCPPDGTSQPGLLTSLIPGGDSSSGCSSCTGGSASAGENSLVMAQNFVPSRLETNTSLGAGMFSNYDFPLRFYRLCPEGYGGQSNGAVNAHKYRAVITDPCSTKTQEWINGEGDAIFRRAHGKGFSNFECVYTEGGSPVSPEDMDDLEGKFATIIREDGYRLIFELKNTTSKAGHLADYFDGRLRKLISPNGQAVTFTYLDEIPGYTPLAGDHSHVLRVHTITDPYGVAATISYAFYGTAQWSWDYAIITGHAGLGEKIGIDYEYGVAGLTKEELEGGPGGPGGPPAVDPTDLMLKESASAPSLPLVAMTRLTEVLQSSSAISWMKLSAAPTTGAWS